MNCVRLFSKPVRFLGYFRKLFIYDSQFSLSLGNIRNIGFIWVLRRHNFREAGSDRFRGRGSGEKCQEKEKFSESIRLGKLRV